MSDWATIISTRAAAAAEAASDAALCPVDVNGDGAEPNIAGEQRPQVPVDFKPLVDRFTAAQARGAKPTAPYRDGGKPRLILRRFEIAFRDL